MNTGSKRFSKIEKTGANSVTIEWYDNYGNVLSNAYAFKDLDSLLTRRPDYKIITIPGLWNHFPQIITTRWNDPRVLSLQQ